MSDEPVTEEQVQKAWERLQTLENDDCYHTTSHPYWQQLRNARCEYYSLQAKLVDQSSEEIKK